MTNKLINEKLRFYYKSLTFKGLADFVGDIMKILMSILILYYYPIVPSNINGNTSQLTWITTVLLIIVILKVFYPACNRLLYGGYEHWICNDIGEERLQRYR